VMAGDPTNTAAWGKLEAINQAIVEKAIQVGGTCTGEHGVGIGKRKFMQMEHGASFELMRQIKNLIDPKGLMNPGKIF
jgi:D-lactate dehydrogenase (cytochrome)